MITVRHPGGAYEVAFTTMSEAMRRCHGLKVTDTNVATHWGGLIDDAIQVQAGESSKSMANYATLLHELARREVLRSGELVAVGGGVVGDLVGFVAATYMRGIKFTQVPTSLLAMVDSSVGGKVGIDLPEGKNLVGAFWAPERVLIPLDALSTLPERHFTNGMAEVWKYGFIADTDLMTLLSRKRLDPKSSSVEEVIARCIELKAQIVEEDPLDRSGRRAILNFGHTVGHALEKATGYDEVLHGEAIAIGMVAEARIGEALGITELGTADQISSLLKRDGLPVWHPLLGTQEVLAAMRIDKKAEGKGLAFSLVTTLGECKLTGGVNEKDVATVLGS